jgi:hypothetical protein
MSIDRAARDEDTPTPATSDNSDRTAERTVDQQADPGNGHAVQRAETRTREEYANAMRGNGRQSADRAETQGTSDSADSDASRPPDRERDGDHAAAPEAGPDRTEPARAETRTREEYAEAMHSNGPLDGDHERAADSGTEPGRDASETAPTVTHFHSEFKDQPLDLYTDGARWAAADTPRTQDTVSEKGEIHDRLPTGEELADSPGESASLMERLRRGVYEESDDETDGLEKGANLVHDVFSHPPTSSYEGTPSQPHISETPHSGIDVGSAATALFTLGLVIDRAIHWAAGHYDRQVRGS